MGCLWSKEHAQILPMQTSHCEKIFTSTTDIHSLYTFGKVLGIGSFGKVVLARMKNNNTKQYAIKIIEKRNFNGREQLLANEVYTLQHLDHPNIIKFYEVYQSELYLYICMEYCEGGELIERIAKQQIIITESQVKNIIFKICSAIAYIHQQGIVHRDIKAENIMFQEGNIYSEPKLIDFGFSNKFDIRGRKKKLKTFVGTPIYIPPEVLDGQYDEKCDIWSLGILLYTLLCGQPPFKGQTKEKLFYNIKEKSLTFDNKVWLSISNEVKDLLQQMLCKNFHNRPSALECLEHQWFKQKEQKQKKKKISIQNTQEEQKTIYQILKTYRNGSKFKKEVTKVLINQMNEKELKHLKDIFQKIDIDNSGTITIEELKTALILEGSIVTNTEIQQLIQTIILEDDDDNQFNEEYDNGESLNQGLQSSSKEQKQILINYTDFLTICIDQRRLFTKERLWTLFKYFDTLNMNYIQKDDIKEAFARHGKQISEEKLDAMIYEIDPNHDNKISFEEFCQMMRNQEIDQTMQIKDDIKEPSSRVD